jgi:hypothetical protein
MRGEERKYHCCHARLLRSGKANVERREEGQWRCVHSDSGFSLCFSSSLAWSRGTCQFEPGFALMKWIAYEFLLLGLDLLEREKGSEMNRAVQTL